MTLHADAEDRPPVAGRPARLGGWLRLLVLLQVLLVFHVLRELLDRMELAQQGLPFQEPTYVTQFVLHLLFVAFVACTTVAMFRRLRTFPALWIMQSFAYVPLLLTDKLMAVVRLDMTLAQALTPFFVGFVAGHLTSAIVGTCYLRASRRAKATFVR
ncbi:DUF2569 family protein [Reyranella sp.]|uniref:DUF2569 family protein n=1 Tax=Reyranella sp. TaxID=1929291 RepID=UPI003BACBFFE